jgi:hypothetical protein
MNSFLPNIHRIIQGIEQNKGEWESRVDEYNGIMEKQVKDWEEKQDNFQSKVRQSDGLV